MSVLDLPGLHAPNRPFAHIEGGRHSYVMQLTAGRMKWAKLMFPEHRRADAVALRAQGFKVIVRAPGEGTVYASDVRLMLLEFQGVAEWFEIGNEPATDPDSLWHHAWFMAYIAGDVLDDCHRAGIKLCTPGWTGNAEPPTRPPDNRRWDEWPANSRERLAARVLQVYGGWKSPNRLQLDTPGFDAIGFHAYGLHVLETPQIERIKRWAATFPGMTLLGTEIGIAARDLIAAPPSVDRYEASIAIKAQRYANFTERLAQIPQVGAAIFFIANGATDEWQDSNGHGFTIGAGGWSYYGQALDIVLKGQRAA